MPRVSCWCRCYMLIFSKWTQVQHTRSLIWQRFALHTKLFQHPTDVLIWNPHTNFKCTPRWVRARAYPSERCHCLSARFFFVSGLCARILFSVAFLRIEICVHWRMWNDVWCGIYMNMIKLFLSQRTLSTQRISARSAHALHTVARCYGKTKTH